jgi:hypothetical protein
VYSLGQSSFNTDLKKELDQIYFKDQLLREYSDTQTSENRKAEIIASVGYSREVLDKELWKIVNYQDSINLEKIEVIISKFGYPGKSLVGEPANETAWYVIQHSKKIAKYFPLIQQAGKNKEIPQTLVAKMEDRKLMNEGKEQIYGTQGAGRSIINDKGEEEFFYFIWPIKNPQKVNQLRKEVGFTDTVEENARKLDIKYSVFTLSDYKKLKLVEFNEH